MEFCIFLPGKLEGFLDHFCLNHYIEIHKLFRNCLKQSATLLNDFFFQILTPSRYHFSNEKLYYFCPSMQPTDIPWITATLFTSIHKSIKLEENRWDLKNKWIHSLIRQLRLRKFKWFLRIHPHDKAAVLEKTFNPLIARPVFIIQYRATSWICKIYNWKTFLNVLS